MIKYFKDAFKYTNENIILATPLVLFMLILSVYLGVARFSNKNLFALILLLVTLLLMISAFLAGWFYMAKKAIDISSEEYIMDEDRTKASFGLIKEFAIGVGDYFFTFIGYSLFVTVLAVALALGVYYLGTHIIGDFGFSIEALSKAAASTEGMKIFLTSLTPEQLMRLNKWNMLFMAVSSLFSFFTLFWVPNIIYHTKNPVTSLFKSIKLVFLKFKGTFVLFIYVMFINFVISFLNTIAAVNPILYFVMSIIYFYFIVYTIVLIFLYYDKEFVEKESCSDLRTDCIGQDPESDTTGTED